MRTTAIGRIRAFPSASLSLGVTLPRCFEAYYCYRASRDALRFVISDLRKGSRFDDFTVVSVIGLL